MRERTEACCFNDIRQFCIGLRCPCGCHEGEPDHYMEAYCTENRPCLEQRVCHRAGCGLPPERHLRRQMSHRI